MHRNDSHSTDSHSDDVPRPVKNPGLANDDLQIAILSELVEVLSGTQAENVDTGKLDPMGVAVLLPVDELKQASLERVRAIRRDQSGRN